jgi:hypothetical protein
MERSKFYQLIDQIADAWVIDANDILKGTYKTTKFPQGTGPRRRTLKSGEPVDVNESNGRVQILKYKPKISFCVNCIKPCEDKLELIDLRNLEVKCLNCGCKYPHKLTETAKDA